MSDWDQTIIPAARAVCARSAACGVQAVALSPARTPAASSRCQAAGCSTSSSRRPNGSWPSSTGGCRSTRSAQRCTRGDPTIRPRSASRPACGPAPCRWTASTSAASRVNTSCPTGGGTTLSSTSDSTTRRNGTHRPSCFVPSTVRCVVAPGGLTVVTVGHMATQGTVDESSPARPVSLPAWLGGALAVLARLAVATTRACLRYRAPGRAAEAGFLGLLSFPPLVLGLVASAGYIGQRIGSDVRSDLSRRVAELASTFLTEDVVSTV